MEHRIHNFVLPECCRKHVQKPILQCKVAVESYKEANQTNTIWLLAYAQDSERNVHVEPVVDCIWFKNAKRTSVQHPSGLMALSSEGYLRLMCHCQKPQTATTQTRGHWIV